jgi:hypothetical protein
MCSPRRRLPPTSPDSTVCATATAAASAADLMEHYTRSRSEGFGPEVKRRILLGTYVLSSGYYDAYYIRAQKARTLIRDDFTEAFKKVDVILSPTSPMPAHKLGEMKDNPLAAYLEDVFHHSGEPRRSSWHQRAMRHGRGGGQGAAGRAANRWQGAWMKPPCCAWRMRSSSRNLGFRHFRPWICFGDELRLVALW